MHQYRASQRGAVTKASTSSFCRSHWLVFCFKTGCWPPEPMPLPWMMRTQRRPLARLWLRNLANAGLASRTRRPCRSSVPCARSHPRWRSRETRGSDARTAKLQKFSGLDCQIGRSHPRAFIADRQVEGSGRRFLRVRVARPSSMGSTSRIARGTRPPLSSGLLSGSPMAVIETAKRSQINYRGRAGLQYHRSAKNRPAAVSGRHSGWLRILLQQR